MEMILFTGVPASGKSSLYEKLFKDTHVRINMDTLKMNYTDYKAKKEEIELIKECIRNGKSFVVDNTNVMVKQRKKYIDIAKENNYKIVSYYIEIDKKTAIARNELREGTAHVPPIAIYTSLSRLETPLKEEGFDELYVVKNTGEEYEITVK